MRRTARLGYLAQDDAFAPGQTNKTFFVTLFNDTTVEANETILLSLSSVVNGTLGGVANAVLTIVDDDTPPAFSGLGFQANGMFAMTLSGPVGQRFAIQVSANLSSWTTVSTLTNTTGTVTYADPGSTNLDRRFYRAMILP